MPDNTVGWFPVLTLLLGFIAKGALDWLQQRSASNREREGREAARRDQLYERRTGFQRQTLLDLQDAMMDVARCTSAMHHEDVMAFRKTEQWHKQLYDEESSEKSRMANARTAVLVVRVRDEAVRNLVAAVKGHSTQVALARSKQESDLEMSAMANEFDNLNKRIGEVLRDLDDEPMTAKSVSGRQ